MIIFSLTLLLLVLLEVVKELTKLYSVCYDNYLALQNYTDYVCMQWCSSYNPEYLGITIVSMGNLWCTPGTYTFKGKPAITKDNITTNLIDSVQIRHCSDNEDAVFFAW